jgi:hypothetical protein
MNDDLRRLDRLSVCCRAVVRDRYGVWTGVTENVSRRGCQIVTARLLRPGTTIRISLSSDLFPEELDAIAEAVWVTPERLGVSFVRPVDRPGALTPEAWLAKVVEHGTVDDGSAGARLVPTVDRSPNLPVTHAAARNGRVVRTGSAHGNGVLRLPLRRA